MNCPKCGKTMLDVRSQKQNPKAPDFQCPDASCLNDKGYRTGAWLPKGKAPAIAHTGSIQPSAPPSASQTPQNGSRDAQLVALYWQCFDEILEGVARRKLTDLFKPEHLCAAVSTLYIQRAKG